MGRIMLDENGELTNVEPSTDSVYKAFDKLKEKTRIKHKLQKEAEMLEAEARKKQEEKRKSETNDQGGYFIREQSLDIDKVMGSFSRRASFKKRNGDILGRGLTTAAIMQKIKNEPWRTGEAEITVADIVATNR